MQEICNNYFLALHYDFSEIQAYDTIDHVEHKDGVDHPLYIHTDPDFDDESIMLYSSAESMGVGDSDDVMQVPLAFWRHRGMGYVPPIVYTRDDLELMPGNWGVSDGDYEGIQHLYPW
jgi:hypothetical protein